MNSTFKKGLAALVSTALLAGTLTACGGAASSSNNSQGNGSTAGGSGGQVTLRVQWWGGDDRHEATLNAIKLFEEKYPNIKIEPEYGGWDGHADKVTTQLAGGTAADVIQINYDWIPTFSRDGSGFYDLDKLSEQIDFSQWDESALEFGRSNGVLNAIPISTTGRSLYYNKTTYDSMGVAVPTTWDELIATGQAFKEKDPTKYPFDLDTGNGFTGWYMSIVHQQQKSGRLFIDGDKLGMTEQDLKEALEFYMSLEENHVIRTQKERMNDQGEDALNTTSKWIDGSIAGVLEWSSSIGKYAQVLTDNANPQELVLGELLVLPDAKINSGWFIKPAQLFAINAKTQYPTESAIFLNWLLNDPEAAVVLGTTRGIPSSKAAVAALEAAGKLENDLARQGTDQIANSNPTLVSPFMENAAMKDLYKVAVESVSYGTATPEQAAQQLFNDCNALLQELAG